LWGWWYFQSPKPLLPPSSYNRLPVEKRGGYWPWGTAALLVTGGALLWSLLSSRFTYGQDHALRPIPEFLAAWGLIFAGMVLAWRLEWGRSWVAPLAVTVGLAARILLWPSGLIQENDVYRYVVDGQVLLHGGNPYRWSPLELPGAAEGDLAEALREPAAGTVLSRVGYPHLPTIYPPGAQLLFAAGALVGGWNWRGQRAVFLLADCLAGWLLWNWLGRRGGGRHTFVLYWWNPLVLKEVANSAHLDVVPALAILLALCLAEIRKEAGGWGTMTALAAGGLAKLYPLLLIPLWVRSRWTGGSSRRKRLLLQAAAVPAMCVLGYLPFSGIGWRRLTESLAAYADRWVMNDGFFALLWWLEHPRWVVAAALGAALTATAWKVGRGWTAATAAYWLLLSWFLLIPTPFPWYALPVAALLPVVSRRHAWPAVVLSGTFCLYYVHFLVEYRGLWEGWWVLARWVEHGAVWVAAVAGLWFGGGSRDTEFGSREGVTRTVVVKPAEE
jgi:hypothetical protein